MFLCVYVWCLCVYSLFECGVCVFGVCCVWSVFMSVFVRMCMSGVCVSVVSV